PTEEMKEPTAGEKAKESDEKKETSPSPENLGEILDSKVETLAEIVKNRLPSFDAKFYHIYKEDKDKVKKAFDSEKTFLIVLNSIIKEADSWSDKELETAVGNLEPIEDVYDEEEMLRSLEGLPDKETPLDNLADDE
ncbi:22803_t:CDS:1, partial [Racocetra persica]